MLRYVSRCLIATFICALVGASARAEFSEYDTETYDYVALGSPKFVKTNYIDLNKVTQISKFRSFAGHDYSDQIEFGYADALKTPGYAPVELCRSMKHYFRPPDENTVIRAPVSGVISRIFEEELATQIHITSDVQPGFTFIIFHIVTPTKAVVGTHVDEGQVLGHHYGQTTDSDIAVAVHTPGGYHLISYFETMTDDLFAQFQARGIATRDEMIIPRATADAILKTGNPCNMFTNGSNDDAQFVKMTGGAASQTLSVTSSVPSQYHVGDTFTGAATASSGLPVSLTTSAPKVCAVDGLSVSFRRPGTCQLQFVQPGNADFFPAIPYYMYATVVAPGAPFTGWPHLGAVYPPAADGTQSYLRFIAGYTGGTVALTLTDAATGADKIHWTSPTIAPLTAPQVAIADIEATAAPGYQRPALYGVRIESVTTLAGTMQHVLYHPLDGTLTNLTLCESGFGEAGGLIGNVHSSNLTGFPSWIAIHNTTAFDYMSEYLNLYDAAAGTHLGTYLNATPIVSNGGAIVTNTQIEQAAKLTPGARNHYLLTATSAPYGGWVQHLVNNTQAGVITDMTAVCNLGGGGIAPPGVPVRGGALFGGQNPSQSFLRFYNAGAAAGPVNLTLYDSAAGTVAAQWTSPNLAPGTELQVAVSSLETALNIAPRDSYEFRIDTDIDGYFQHVLWRAVDGTLTNLSTCRFAVSADPYTLIGVHSSVVGGQGYPSQVLIISTGLAAQSVALGIYDAANNTKLGTYPVKSIPAGAQAVLDVSTIETAAHVTPTAGQYHYVIKAEAPFTGFLQHLVNNQRSGVVTDMTSVCGM